MGDTITLTVSIELYEYLHRHIDIQMRHYRLMARERPKKAHIYEPKQHLFNQGLTDFETANNERKQKIHSLRKDGKQAKPFSNSNEVERKQPIEAGRVPRPLLPYLELVQRVGQKTENSSGQLYKAPSPGHEIRSSRGNGLQTIKGLDMALQFRLTTANRKELDAIKAKLGQTSLNKTVNAMIAHYLELLEQLEDEKAKNEHLTHELAQKDLDLEKISDGFILASKYAKTA